MANIIKILETLTAEQKEGALIVLDALTHPLNEGEVAWSLRKGGVSRAQAVEIANLLNDWNIVAMMEPAHRKPRRIHKGREVKNVSRYTPKTLNQYRRRT